MATKEEIAKRLYVVETTLSRLQRLVDVLVEKEHLRSEREVLMREFKDNKNGSTKL